MKHNFLLFSSFCTSSEFLYSDKSILFNNVCNILICTGYCHCRTDTSSTVDIHGPLETIGKTACLGGFSVFSLTIRTCRECSWHGERHTEIISCNYWIDAQNNWNWHRMWLKWFPRLRGSSPSKLYCKIQNNWCTVTVAPTIEHQGGHSRTPAKQRWDQVPGRSQRHLLC